MDRAIGLALVVVACGDNHRGSGPVDSSVPLDDPDQSPIDGLPDGLFDGLPVASPDVTAPETTLTQSPPALAVVATASLAFVGEDASDAVGLSIVPMRCM